MDSFPRHEIFSSIHFRYKNMGYTFDETSLYLQVLGAKNPLIHNEFGLGHWISLWRRISLNDANLTLISKYRIPTWGGTRSLHRPTLPHLVTRMMYEDHLPTFDSNWMVAQDRPLTQLTHFYLLKCWSTDEYPLVHRRMVDDHLTHLTRILVDLTHLPHTT